MMTTQAYADRDISGALKEEIFCNYGRYKVFITSCYFMDVFEMRIVDRKWIFLP